MLLKDFWAYLGCIGVPVEAAPPDDVDEAEEVRKVSKPTEPQVERAFNSFNLIFINFPQTIY